MSLRDLRFGATATPDDVRRSVAALRARGMRPAEGAAAVPASMTQAERVAAGHVLAEAAALLPAGRAACTALPQPFDGWQLADATGGDLALARALIACGHVAYAAGPSRASDRFAVATGPTDPAAALAFEARWAPPPTLSHGQMESSDA